jgi:regulator of protease activity HflC (stomatin/prohibitin superfamily)
MFVIGTRYIRSFEKGLLFKENEFTEALQAGRHWFYDPLGRLRVDTVSQRSPWLVHRDLDMIVRSGALREEITVLDLTDYERALVWVDNRFDRILDPGLYAFWNTFRDVRVEIVDARKILFEHEDLNTILESQVAEDLLRVSVVEEGHVGVYFKDGDYVTTLAPGRYAFWLKGEEVKVYPVDLRQKVLDVSGQEIMTADKVSIRINAVVTYRVSDPRRSVEEVTDVDQAVYRDAQLALRGVVGTRELDDLLADRAAVADELESMLRNSVDEFGLTVISLGIRDIILPGDMKALFNKVIEALKASEANVIARREEIAAIRSQLNSAKLMEANPSLMRLRELETLERVAQSSKLNVVLGEKGLVEQVINLL